MLPRLTKWVGKSPWVFHLNTGATCNGCDIEILAALTPRYDAERFGVLLVGTPRHADVLLATGAVNHQNMPKVKRIYDQVPNPKMVIAVGACALSCGVFNESYCVDGPLDQVIPVDVYVPGCPPRPEAILFGVVKAFEKLERLVREAENEE